MSSTTYSSQTYIDLFSFQSTILDKFYVCSHRLATSHAVFLISKQTSHTFIWAQTISSPLFHTIFIPNKGQTTSGRLTLLPRGIVVERFSLQDFVADFPFETFFSFRYLGSHLIPSQCFFLLSSRSHLDISHSYVLAHWALGGSSSSICSHMDFHHMLQGDYSSLEGFTFSLNIIILCIFD